MIRGTREAVIPTILVVDDDPHVRQLVRDILEFEGYLVDTANDGASALVSIGLSRPDCVVLDILMPGLSGHSVLARLREADEPDRPLPVVMLTAAADPAEVWQAWAGGVDYFLAKPFDPSELLRYLDDLFSGGPAPRRPHGARAQRC